MKNKTQAYFNLSSKNSSSLDARNKTADHKPQLKNCFGFVMTPVSAEAATVYGDAKYTCDFFDPILPGKFLFVDEMQTSTPLSLPNVSDARPSTLRTMHRRFCIRPLQELARLFYL